MQPKKIIIEQDVIETVSPRALSEILSRLGFDVSEVLVTDLTTFLDLMSMFDYPTLESAQVKLDELFQVKLDPEMTLIEAITVLQRSHPDWPDVTLN